MTIFIQDDKSSYWQYVVFDGNLYPEMINYMTLSGFSTKFYTKERGNTYMYEVGSDSVDGLLGIIRTLDIQYEIVISNELNLFTFAKSVRVFK